MFSYMHIFYSLNPWKYAMDITCHVLALIIDFLLNQQ
jgi:hypothetical protein